MAIERKEIRLLETKASDSEPGAFSGYGAIFGNVDLKGDVIQSGAFASTLSEWKDAGKLPPMLLQHGGGFFGGTADDLLPIGQWTEMSENSRGLKVEGKLFALGTERGQYIYEGLKAGVLDGLSIGYSTRKSAPGTRGGQPVRVLTDLELMEVSIVTFPANPKATITAVKALTLDQLRELEDDLRDGGLSRTDCKRAVTVFKQYLQRDAGESRGLRDADAADEITEILGAARKSEAVLIGDVLGGLLEKIKST